MGTFECKNLCGAKSEYEDQNKRIFEDDCLVATISENSYQPYTISIRNKDGHWYNLYERFNTVAEAKAYFYQHYHILRNIKR